MTSCSRWSRGFPSAGAPHSVVSVEKDRADLTRLIFVLGNWINSRGIAEAIMEERRQLGSGGGA